jgi:hypothetical protein
MRISQRSVFYQIPGAEKPEEGSIVPEIADDGFQMAAWSSWDAWIGR